MTVEDFGVGTMNIPAATGQAGDLPPATVTKVAKAAEAQVGLLATQETSEDEDNRALDKALPPARWWHFGPSSENDLMVKKSRWAICPPGRLPKGVQAHRIHFLSPGKEHISPHRDLNHVVLVWVDHPEWDPFVWWGSHYIVVKEDGSYDFRLDARADEVAETQDNVGYWLDHGLNVVGGLDSNAHKLPLLGPGWQWCVEAGHNGIDKIGFANAPASNWEISYLSRETYANAADHDFQVANLRATARAS